MIEGYQGCEKCPLKDRPAVLGKGKCFAEYALVGEAPGYNEVIKKEPFVGVTGQLLRNSLRALGLDPEKCWITNAVLCHPEGNKTPSPTAVQCCHQRLLDELWEVHPKKILALGGTALSSLVGEGKATPITKWRGQGLTFNSLPWEDPVYMISTYHPSAVNRDPDLFRDFAMDVLKLMTYDRPVPTPEIEVIIPFSVEEMQIGLNFISNASFISCDLETTGFAPTKERIISIGFGALSIGGPGFSLIIPIEVAEGGKDILREFFRSWDKPMLFHNIKFDLQFLQVWFGEHIRPQIPKDTMLMQYAQDERGSGGGGGRGYRVHSLKDQARIRYDIPDYHFDFDKFYAQPEEERDYNSLYQYQGMDVYVTCRLYEDLTKELMGEDPDLLSLCEKVLVPAALAFCEIEMIGFPIDIPYLESLKLKTQLELEEQLTRLQALAHKHGIEDFNPNSPLKVKNTLKAVGFNPVNTEKETLQLHLKTKAWPDETKELVQGIIDFRQKSKVLQTYINGILSRVDEDGRVRSDFLVHGADTGRIASRDPNLQNIPVLMGQQIRDAFISVPGYKLVEADESQVELRIAAWYCQDENLKNIFKEGRDIHREVAADIFEKPAEEITYYERYMAKYVDFGVVYGRGAKSLTEGFEAEYIIEHLGGHRWSLTEAQHIIDRFLAPYPMLVSWIRETQKKARAQGYIEQPTGRRRRFPLITRESILHIERQAVNSGIQGLASDVCITSLTRLNDMLPEGAYVISTVHDSIMFLIRDDLVDQVVPMIIDVMTHPTIIDLGDLPLGVEIHVGDRWGGMKGDETLWHRSSE